MSGLFQRTAKKHGANFVSRDYAGELHCLASTCPINRRGLCSMLSAVTIGPDGTCKTFLKLKAEPPVLPKGFYCKICGARIIADVQTGSPVRVKWSHANCETFSHTAEPRDLQ